VVLVAVITCRVRKLQGRSRGHERAGYLRGRGIHGGSADEIARDPQFF